MQIGQVTVHNSTLFTLTQTFRYLNCCCNFFLYSATSSLFRRELREIFNCTDSLKPNHKVLNNDDISRKKSLIPAPHASFDHTNLLSERKSMLLSIPTRATAENLNLPDSTNGHMTSVKT